MLRGGSLQQVKLFDYMTPELLGGLREFNRHLKPNGHPNPNPMWVFSFEGDDNTKAVRFFPGMDRLELVGGQWV